MDENQKRKPKFVMRDLAEELLLSAKSEDEYQLISL